MKKRIRIALNLWRLWFLAIFWSVLGKDVKKLVNEDVSRIESIAGRGGFIDLCMSLIGEKSFRNVFYYHTKGKHRILRKVMMLLFPFNGVIEISSENIGGGYTSRIVLAA